VSKKWKVAIGVVIAAVVVAGVALAAWGAVTFRNRVYERGWQPGVHKWGPEAATQLRCPEPCPEPRRRVVEGEVRLVDDDGDGIPDRGVIEAPAGLPFGRSFGPGRGPSTMLRTGSCFGPGHGLYFGRGFGPFFIVGGLFRLAFLALLIGLGVVCFRCWSRAKEAREPQRG
jgi:hypothetical protein